MTKRRSFTLPFLVALAPLVLALSADAAETERSRTNILSAIADDSSYRYSDQ
jgi:hypothetical protein